MSRLATILHAIACEPRTPVELAGQLGSSVEALRGMLRTLRDAGYVQEALPGQGECHCGPCALKSMCRNANGEEPELQLLRITPKGEAYLRHSQPTEGQ